VDDEAEFCAFVRSRGDGLQRMAWLLTSDWAMAEDLVQSSLAKTWQRWGKIRRQDAPEAYVRRVMMTTFLAWRRRRWTGEIAVAVTPEVATGDTAGDIVQKQAVAAALRRLPKQQRAVIVLRYFADLSEQATADTLRCSVGTVKSQAFRALATLRSNGALQAAITEGTR
jgi:RNA polymerase sigma-70 factor (sigma-E family)